MLGIFVEIEEVIGSFDSAGVVEVVEDIVLEFANKVFEVDWRVGLENITVLLLDECEIVVGGEVVKYLQPAHTVLFMVPEHVLDEVLKVGTDVLGVSERERVRVLFELLHQLQQMLN